MNRSRKPLSNTVCLRACLSLLAMLFGSIALAAEPPITDVAFAPDGKSVVTVSQAGIQTFSWPELTLQATIEADAPNLHCLAFSPNGFKLAVGGGYPAREGSVELFDWPDGERIMSLSIHNDSVAALAWWSNSELFTASHDRSVHRIKVNTVSIQNSFAGHSRGVASVCLLSDRRTLVTAGRDQSLRVWNLETGQQIRSLSQHTQPIHALAERPPTEGLPMIASAAADRTIRFWQPTIGRMVRYVRLESEPLDIVWLADRVHLAAACVDGKVRVINTETVKVVQTLPGIDRWAYALAVHGTDGSLAVAGANGQLTRVEVGPLDR